VIKIVYSVFMKVLPFFNTLVFQVHRYPKVFSL